MIITFCGHRDIDDEARIAKWLCDTCRYLILGGAKTFYLGGYGQFDRMTMRILDYMKSEYSNIHRILVLPYPDSLMPARGYDATVYPPLESVPKRLAILKRNEWMVDQADILVAYVTHSWGGAAQTLAYAEKKKKLIMRYSD